MATTRTIWIVLGGGILVISYDGPNARWLAETHARCLTGGDVVPLKVADSLPESIRDDIASESEFGDDDTPQVVDVDD